MISLNGLKIRVSGLDSYKEVEIRTYRLNKEMSELRFWKDKKLLDIKNIKNRDLSKQISGL
jgi:hypothetical protein